MSKIKKKTNTIFTKKFKKIKASTVVRELNTKGYFVFNEALNKKTVNQIEKDATTYKLNLNHNKISGVYNNTQYYLTNLLAVSKTFYNFVTSDFCLQVCSKYLGKKFRLKALRYYETYGGHHMQWHTDNKTDRKFSHIPGIIFIFYVSDVSEGEFQYIEGSHLWSGRKSYSNYSDSYIEKKMKKKIKSFKCAKGSLIIYNTYGIHRANPVKNKNFSRKSVFFQVDSEIENSEPIILNTKFLTKINNQISMLLGFGKPSDYEVYPNTSLKTLPFTRNIFYTFFYYFLYRVGFRVFNLFPNNLKKLFLKFKNLKGFL